MANAYTDGSRRENLLDILASVTPLTHSVTRHPRVGVFSTNLARGILSSEKSIDLMTVQGLPAMGTLVISRNTPTEEFVDYSLVSSSQVNNYFVAGCSRGVSGTTPNAHPAGTPVELAFPVSKQDEYFSEKKERTPRRKPDELSLEDYMKVLSKNDE